MLVVPCEPRHGLRPRRFEETRKVPVLRLGSVEQHLKGLRYLRNLAVGQSKVTEAGLKGLKAALPNVEVSTGRDSAALMKKADEERK